MLGRVAELHYKHGMTHQQVADLLGLSRVQVTRLLARARTEGVVEIRVHSEEPIFPREQAELIKRFGLESVWLAPSFDSSEETLDSIGAVGASYLRSVLKPGMTVAVGLSSTLARIAPQLSIDPMEVTFVPAIGSRPAGDGTVNPHQVAELLAEATGGRSGHLAAPFLASSAETAAMISREPDIATTLNQARMADLGVFGLGGTSLHTGILVDSLDLDMEAGELKDSGVVGDISAALFNHHGESIRTSLSDRIVGLRMNEILQIPHRAVFVGGAEKLESIRGALNGGICTTLVTDIDTARALLE